MRAAAALISTVLIVTACHAGGNAEETRAMVQRNIQVPGPFDRIALAGSTDVVVAVGGAPSIRAEGDAETLDRLEVTVEGGQLRIGLREGSRGWFRWGSHRGVTVHVTMPALAAASIAGSGDMRIDRVEGARFAGSVTGSGDMNVGALAVGEADFSVTGSGDIRAAGRSQRASATVVGSGDLRLGGLETANATLSVAGSGDIGIRATETAAIELRGSGDVTVAGPAHCTISKSGSGDVHCEG
ncbi:MAG TPA: head GIN domain-containing protein [Allosphingosinicella sp.]|nr:head GIN domain-containing protein [Allosphingosinicella sp.]